MQLKNAFSSLANFSFLLPKHQLNDACACGLRVIITAAVVTQGGGMYLQGVGTLNRLSLKPHSDAKQQAVKVVHCHSLSWTRCVFTLHSSFSGSRRWGSRLHHCTHTRIRCSPKGFRLAVTMPLVFHQLEVFSAAVGWEIAKHPCHLKRRIMIPALLTKPHRWASANRRGP